MKKRKIDIAVVSDIHLGASGCCAGELLSYLNSIRPKILVLNGDIIDFWQLGKGHFPKPHLQVIKKIIDLSTKETEVYYITGNHDEALRKFGNISLGNIHISDTLMLELDNKKTWFLHGNIFDASIQRTKHIARLGHRNYYYLAVLNKLINRILGGLGRKKYSLSGKIKNNAKKAAKYITDFEKAASDLAIAKGYKYVICGHIHHPQLLRKVNRYGTCLYLNSGDWVENLSALEYRRGKWKLYYFKEDKLSPFYADEELKTMDYKELLAAITITGKR